MVSLGVAKELAVTRIGVMDLASYPKEA